MNISSQSPPRGSGPSRTEIPGSYIVVANTTKGLPENSDVHVERVLGHVGDSTFLQVQLAEGEDSLPSGSCSGCYPNYRYTGQLYDEPVGAGPQLLAGVSRPGHLQIINIEPAWQQTKGSPSALGAVTDTGLDLKHPVLQGSIWTNPKEIVNGIDDDGNGYIDDIHGWDFSDDDADPGDTLSDHHTHVHGIVHAQEGSSGATGVAPGAQSMALRVSGGENGFSSAVLVESYLYALNQGAKSINTSFNIDGFVGDKALQTTYRKLLDSDVLIFNSAGNSGAKNPLRSRIEDIVLVASTDTAGARVDKRSSFSNYGSGVDIAAPGRDIASTLPNGRVGLLSGTSMASPVAMGVDLLLQSAHPDWNAAQRWAQMAGTADNIDRLNPENVQQLGAGRVNAGRALTEELAPPTLSARELKNPKGITTGLTVRFDKVLDPASANDPESWTVFNSQGEPVRQGPPREIRLMTNEIDFNLAGLPAGSYQLVGSAEHLQDPFGQHLAEDFQRSVEIR